MAFTLYFCREVVMLKSLWDVIALVKSSFGDWNTTLWRDINVENMEMDCKKFVKVPICIYLLHVCVHLLLKHSIPLQEHHGKFVLNRMRSYLKLLFTFLRNLVIATDLKTSSLSASSTGSPRKNTGESLGKWPLLSFLCLHFV